jgi:hypothetical protein
MWLFAEGALYSTTAIEEEKQEIVKLITEAEECENYMMHENNRCLYCKSYHRMSFCITPDSWTKECYISIGTGNLASRLQMARDYLYQRW